MDKIRLDPLAEKILNIIRKSPGSPKDIKELTKTLNVCESDIISALNLLKNWGYTIDSGNSDKISFIDSPDSLIDTEISYSLETKIFGRKIYAYQRIQSTNSIATQLADSGAAEGTIIIAEQQTKGRGRLGRKWFSPAGNSLYFSLILRPKIHPRQAPGISLITAVALTETISTYGNLPVKVKWPNDVLIGGRKTAGILTELSAEPDIVNFIVVGIGININHKKNDFPEEICNLATSLRIELGKKVKRVQFLKRLLVRLENEYLLFKKSGLTETRPKLVEYSSLIGNDITLRIGRRSVSGRVMDIDEDGRLIVATPTGPEAFIAGEVTTH